MTESEIENPNIKSFKAQLLEATNSYNCSKKLHKDDPHIKTSHDRYQKKISILQDLIKKFGENPCEIKEIIGTVYGIPDVDSYETSLKTINHLGTTIYCDSYWRRIFVADGTGKYKFDLNLKLFYFPSPPSSTVRRGRS